MSRSSQEQADVLIFYHFFHPDDVVSARQLTDLAVGLSERGCNVEAMPSNRSCRSTETFEANDRIGDVQISRIWRPGLEQSSTIGRIVNLSWMLLAWTFCAFRRKPDVLIVGTDPILSVLVSLPWKLIRPKTRILHWCFDVYPDAAIKSGLLDPESLLTKFVSKLCCAAYNKCDAVVDIGPCMRDRLPEMQAKQDTLTPWALEEPVNALPIHREERQRVFGDTELAILYSGSFGEAHSYEDVLSLARKMRDKAVFAFSVTGNQVAALKSAVTTDDTNIKFVDFADEAHLTRRLACADIHLVTLKSGWEGIVVPSKFFGSLAIGRPVLYSGPKESAIYRWIEEYRVGWSVNDFLEQNLSEALNTHCHQVYQGHFSRQSQIDGWKELVDS